MRPSFSRTPSLPRFQPAPSRRALALSTLNSNFVVRAAEARRVVDDASGGDAGATVDEVLHALAIEQQRHRLSHGGVAPDRMARLGAAALAVDFRVRVVPGELDELERAAGRDEHAPLAAVFHAPQHVVLDLQVPREVELAGLQHRARRRHGVAAALDLDAVEVRPVRLVIVRVDLAAQQVARLEVDEAEGPGADGLEIRGGLARLARRGRGRRDASGSAR